MLFVCEKEYAAAWQILGLYALPCFLFSLSLSLSHSVIYCCHNASKTDGNAIFFFEQKNEMKLEYEISITFFNSQNLSNSTHLMLIAIGTCIVCFFGSSSERSSTVYTKIKTMRKHKSVGACMSPSLLHFYFAFPFCLAFYYTPLFKIHVILK